MKFLNFVSILTRCFTNYIALKGCSFMKKAKVISGKSISGTKFMNSKKNIEKVKTIRQIDLWEWFSKFQEAQNISSCFVVSFSCIQPLECS
jgi:hypothetical protein